MLKHLSAATVFALGMATVPAAAQEDTTDSYNMVIIYGDDECPRSTDEQIVVCARQAESERFRIPENLRLSDNPENQAWAKRVERLEMVGDTGIMSCSPVGAGGFTGCTQKMIAAAYADKAEGSDVRFGQLIDAAREERLSTIDAEAAAEQERVEQLEREYMERLERERAAPAPGEDAEPLPQTAPVTQPADEALEETPEG